MRTFSIAILGLVAMVATAAGPRAPARHAAEPHGSSDVGAAWRDSINAWIAAGSWARVDTAAARRIVQLESDPPPDSMALSSALRDHADARWHMRNIRDGVALASAERAALMRERLERGGSRFSAQARLLASRIASQLVRHEHSAALAETVVTWAEHTPIPDSGLVVTGEHLIAMAHQALGRTDEAHASFDRAFAWTPERVMRTPEIVPMLSDRALFLSQIGDFDAAEAGMRQALTLTDQAPPGSDLPENVLSRLSTIQLRMGDLAESVESASRSLAAVRARMGSMGSDAVYTLFARVRLANRLAEFGDHRGRLEELRDVLPRLERTLGNSHPTTINVRLAYTEELMHLGDHTWAGQQLALARESMQSQPSVASSNPTYLRLLEGRSARSSGERERARDSLAVGLSTLAQDRLGDNGAALLIEYFESVIEPADTLALRRAATWADSLGDSTRIRQNPVWFELLAARSRAELRAGRDADAWPRALAAESLAHTRLVNEVRALPDARGLQLLDRYAVVLDGMVAALGAGGSAETAWDRLVGWRGLVRDEIAQRRPVRGEAADTALAGAHERWAFLQRRVARLVVSGSAHPDDPTSAVRYAAARADAEDAERRFARIARLEPAAREAPTLASIRAGLRAGEALVGFAIADRGDGERTLVAFVARAGEPRVRVASLGAVHAVEAAIESWVAQLATPPGADARIAERRARRGGERVRSLVWAPIAGAIGDARTVFVVPVAPLDDLPWLALPTADGRYLAEEPFEIRVLTSERDVIRTPLRTESASSVLAIGDPDFDRPGTGASAEPAPSGSLRAARPGVPCLRAVPRLGALPSARTEALDIASGWPDSSGVRVLVGSEALEVQVKRLAPGRTVLHMATHGIVIGDDCAGADLVGVGGMRGVGGVSPIAPSPSRRASRRPASSAAPAARPAAMVSPWLGKRVWLALAGANQAAESVGDENDGLLTAEEVVTLDLGGTDWVVLSACQSGVAEGWAREGVPGMRRAFHLAGARSVIASRWPVADEATRAWMLALYDARPRTPSAGSAVREAARAVVSARRSRGQTTHPFYWAAFSATGD